MSPRKPAVYAHRSGDLPSDRIRDAITDRFRAGDTIDLLAWDYDLHPLAVEYCLRLALRKNVAREGRMADG